MLLKQFYMKAAALAAEITQRRSSSRNKVLLV
jgi:hypothetical protein